MSAPTPIPATPATVAERASYIHALLAWLEHDPDAVEWAAKMRAGDEHAKVLEQYRWKLTNCVLKPAVKNIQAAITTVDPSDSYAFGAEVGRVWSEYVAAFDEPNAEGETATLAALLKATLPFDRANALFIMKIDRANPECPAGFAWITEDDMDKYKPKFQDKDQFHSCAKAYVEVALNHPDPAVRAYVRDMTRCMVPSWMKRADETGALAECPTELDLRVPSEQQ